MKKKPTVLLDCDGILADFVGFILEHVNRISRSESPVFAADVDEWDISKALDGHVRKHVIDRAFDAVAMKGACRFEIKPYPGAHEGLELLQEAADVFVVTSPMNDAPTWMSERERWLHDHFGFPRHKVIHTGAKHMIHGDFLVDDKVQNVREWFEARPNRTASDQQGSASLGYPVVWDQPWNLRENVPFHRVRDWKELLSVVEWPAIEQATIESRRAKE